jgi:hypothetical protein
MRLQSKKNPMELLAAVLLIGIFGISALLLTVSGSGVYHRISTQMSSSGQLRTGLSFAVNLVRSAGPGNAFLDENEILTVRHWYGDSEYRTYLYCRDGWLMELFTRAEDGFTPEYGEQLCRLSDFFSVCEPNGLITFTAVSEQGEMQSVSVYAK